MSTVGCHFLFSLLFEDLCTVFARTLSGILKKKFIMKQFFATNSRIFVRVLQDSRESDESDTNFNAHEYLVYTWICYDMLINIVDIRVFDLTMIWY